MTSIDAFVEDLGRKTLGDRRSVRRLLDEVHDHLVDSVAHNMSNGLDPKESLEVALAAFGETDYLAMQFNASIGAKAVRRAPIIVLGTGFLVVFAFLRAVTSYPRTTNSATLSTQVTYFAAVIAMQIAVLAGARSLARALSIWRGAERSGVSRDFVRRSALISISSLLVGVIFISINFIFVERRFDGIGAPQLLVGAGIMAGICTCGIVSITRLRFNRSFVDESVGVPHRNFFLGSGEKLFNLVRFHPVISLGSVALLAPIWVMGHAETSSFFAGWPWGLAELTAILGAYFLLGKALELRPTVDA